MSIWKLISVASLFVLSTATLALVMGKSASTQAKPPEDKSDVLIRILIDLGNTHDRFFTIEQGWVDGESMNQLEAQRVKAPSGNKPFEEQLEELRQEAGNFVYEVNRENPKIVHIIDARLLRQSGYGVGRSVAGINFKGTVKELLEELGRKDLPVSWPGFTWTHEYLDFTSQGRVTGEELRVRDALTLFFPLEPHIRILWTAKTRIGPGEVSWIYFSPRGK